MVLDARAAESDSLLADVCIVGGGAAGLTLAASLADTPLRVIVLEGGGAQADDHSQQMYRGATAGQPYYALEACRIRALGGTTNTWGGWCRPLDPIDFRERPWLPHSGWPFDRATLNPFYQRAHAVCRLGPFDYDPAEWRRRGRTLVPEHSPELCETLFHIGPTRFAQRYLAVLRRAPNVRLLLHATALELHLDAAGSRVTSLSAAAARRRFTVQAATTVIAAGGIENARLLLASRRHQPCGIGNTHDLVGRFFADHLHVPIGRLQPRLRRHRFRPVHRINGMTIRGAATLSEAAQAQDRLPGFALTFHDDDDPHDVLSPGRMPPAYESLATLVRAARQGQRPPRTLHHLGNVVTGLNTAAALASRKVWQPLPRQVMVGCRLEQAPNPASRVTLDDRDDDYGMPRARLEWRLTANDDENFARVEAICRRALGGEAWRFTPGDPGDGSWLDRMRPGAHHMGTTRMHADARRGVVDENSRVHGVGNLFVAGSSVFPTGGWAPPTLTIIALTLRLADHLRRQLAPGAPDRGLAGWRRDDDRNPTQENVAM